MRRVIQVVVLVGAPFLAYLLGTRFGDHSDLLSIEPGRIDLGTHLEGEVIEASLVVRNRSSEPIKVDRVDSTCGCLVVGQDGEPPLIGNLTVEARGNLRIPLRLMTSGRWGQQAARVTVHTNSKFHSKLESDLLWTVQPSANAWPAMVALGTIKPGDMAEHIVEIVQPVSSPEFQPSKVSVSDSKRIAVESREVFDIENWHGNAVRKVLRLKIRFEVPMQDTEVINEQLTVFAKNERLRPIEIPIFGKVVPPVSFIPSEPVVFGVRSDELVSCQIRCQLEEPYSPAMLCVLDAPPEIQVLIGPVENAHSRRIDLKCRLPAANMPITHEITFGVGCRIVKLPVTFANREVLAH